MPNYEYSCTDCKRSFEIFLTYEGYETEVVVCPLCKNTNVQRKISRVLITRSEESRFENLADPDALAGIEDDPKAMGRMMRKMGSEVGEDMGPEFNEVVTRLEAGQSPEEIEKDLPDLGPGDAGGFDDMIE